MTNFCSGQYFVSQWPSSKCNFLCDGASIKLMAV